MWAHTPGAAAPTWYSFIPTLAAVALAWYSFILLVVAIGSVQLFRHFLKPTPKPTSPKLPIARVPHVTIIRPIKGLEPCLYECLAATFQQTYPPSKLTVSFCISSSKDPAFPIIERLVSDHKGFDASIYLEEEDPNLSGRNDRTDNLGPNPKIRNMSRAYREAKGDLVWIIDCNVWVSKSVCGLMVDYLCGLGPLTRGRKYKLVHQLPISVDISHMSPTSPPTQPQSSGALFSRISAYAGGLLDEMFLSTAHAKFYTAISTVAVAPCIVGKSNMFRRSHLAALTPSSTAHPDRSPGLDFFSDNICEDHLIGDLLWKSPIPASVLATAALEGLAPGDALVGSGGAGKMGWGNHAILPAPPCIQPLAQISLSSYVARRARWLRVRKFTVPLATLVEPGTEAVLATAFGAYGLAEVYGGYQCGGVVQRRQEDIFAPLFRGTFWCLWLLGMVAWGTLDWYLWNAIQEWGGEEVEEQGSVAEVSAPFFVRSCRRKSFRVWLGSWLGREILAWPVWAWAVLGGTEIIWRGRRFRVGVDMKVHALDEEAEANAKCGKGV